MVLTKQQAIDIFGSSGADLARALGCTRSAISLWPEELSQKQTDTVIGAATRLGRPVPSGFLPTPTTTAVAA